MNLDLPLKDRAITWITAHAEVREVFKHPDMLQTSYDGAKDTIFADVLVTLDGERHDLRRKTETVLFRPQIVDALENTVVPAEAARLIEGLRKGAEADLTDISRLVTTGLAARIIGFDDCATVERLEELCGLAARLHQGAIIDWATRPREEILADVRLAKERYRERFFAPSLARRQALVAAGGPQDPRDLIHLLLVHARDLALDTEMLLRETIHYLVATGGTTTSVFTHGCHEIWNWVAAHPEDRPKLADPLFVQACMNEATRLWSPSGWQLRRAAKDLTLRSGRQVRAGETLGLYLLAANRDATVYGEDAEHFNPNRPEARHATSVGLSYGDGDHVCLGKRLAMGVPGREGATGILTAMALALFKAGGGPHPERPPVIQSGTARHYFQRYPVRFAG